MQAVRPGLLSDSKLPEALREVESKVMGAAERAAAIEREGLDIVRVGLQQDGHLQPGQAHRVSDALLVALIRLEQRGDVGQ